MNKKAEAFQAYLQEKNIKAFEMTEVPNDDLNTVVFRSTIVVEGQSLPALIILDSSIYGMIRVRIAGNALKETNAAKLGKVLNEMNAKYKIFKYFLAADGTLVLDAYVLAKPGEVDSAMIFTVLDVVVKHLESEYKNVMKAIWA